MVYSSASSERVKMAGLTWSSFIPMVFLLKYLLLIAKKIIASVDLLA